MTLPFLGNRHWQALVPFAVVVAASFLAVTLFQLGLPGSFLLDDYPNLELLGKHGGIKDTADVLRYLEDGGSGPTGRPLSMLSFLLDAKDWPSAPGPFKAKNILIHIVNGFLLFGLLRLALTQARVMRTGVEAAWVAAIAATLWLLHPFHVSTVLYVVQRMAELSALFMLAGLLGYFYGRQWLERAPTRAYWVMSSALVLGTLLAVLSKENGALLPLLVWVIELTLFATPDSARLDRRWSLSFLVLPSLALFGYLTYLLVTGWGERSITHGLLLSERLLTEPRILVEYLWYLVVPQPHTMGIFRDAYTLSTSLWEPVTTLPASLFLVLLAAAAWMLRRRLPIMSVAILFFLAGHLLESSVVMLELYYEHRNYLPSTLLFLPVAQGVVVVFRSRPRQAVVIASLVLLVFASMLGARSELWSDRARLFGMWAMLNPHSERAQLSVANELFLAGNPGGAAARLEESVGNLPDSLMLRLHLLRFKAVGGGLVSRAEVQTVRELAGRVRVTQEAVMAMEYLTNATRLGQNAGLSSGAIAGIWQAFLSNPGFTATPGLAVKTYHFLGALSTDQGRVQEAMDWFEKALTVEGSTETAAMQAAVLAAHGHYCEALAMVGRAQGLLPTDERARRREAYFTRELGQLRQTIEGDVKTAGLTCGVDVGRASNESGVF